MPGSGCSSVGSDGAPRRMKVARRRGPAPPPHAGRCIRGISTQVSRVCSISSQGGRGGDGALGWSKAGPWCVNARCRELGCRSTTSKR